MLDPHDKHVGEVPECHVVMEREEVLECGKLVSGTQYYKEVKKVSRNEWVLTLGPLEKTFLMLCFQSFRVPSEKERDLARFVTARDVTLLFKKEKNCQPLAGNIFRVLPLLSPIDYVFDLEAGFETQFSVELPCLFCFVEHGRRQRPKLVVSEKSVSFHLNDFD